MLNIKALFKTKATKLAFLFLLYLFMQLALRLSILLYHHNLFSFSFGILWMLPICTLVSNIFFPIHYIMSYIIVIYAANY